MAHITIVTGLQKPTYNQRAPHCIDHYQPLVTVIFVLNGPTIFGTLPPAGATARNRDLLVHVSLHVHYGLWLIYL